MNVVELLGLPALEEQLKRLEPLLVESVVTGDGFLDEVTTHLLAAGGKRLRPVLALATATSGIQPASREDLLGAVAVELVHLASLYHDDVMDEATMRRNVESVNARFGNLVAIVAGKTASLMATSCRIGALTGGLPRLQIDAFTTFGRYFGMIFQVRDDILDVVGTEAELGKPAGQDLAEGIYTLPVLLALADPVAGPELRPLLGQPLGQPERDKARSIVAESGAIEGSVVVARRYAELAAAAATSGPSAELATGFAKLAHSLVDGLPTA